MRRLISPQREPHKKRHEQIERVARRSEPARHARISHSVDGTLVARASHHRDSVFRKRQLLRIVAVRCLKRHATTGKRLRSRYRQFLLTGLNLQWWGRPMATDEAASPH